MKTATKITEKYSLEKTGQYENRTNLIFNDGNGRCAVIEHYYMGKGEQKELEEKILKGLNNYDNLLSTLKEVADYNKYLTDIFSVSTIERIREAIKIAEA